MRYRCQCRSGPLTQSSRQIPSGTGIFCSAAISPAHNLLISEVPKSAYFSLRTRTRLMQPRSLITKSKGSWRSVSTAISTNPHSVALRCASPIATTGLYPRVIRPHPFQDMDPDTWPGLSTIQYPGPALIPYLIPAIFGSGRSP